jgi:hypothetical protein
MVYCPKDHILDIMRFFRRKFDLADIDDRLHFLANADVNVYLYNAYITPPVTDIGHLLEAAELCFYMEQAGMVKQIENAFGVLREETIGNFTKRYENGMPMFFFAQGASLPFLNLLPHETWRMRGYKYVDSYLKAYWNANKGTRSQWGCVAQDTTARGYGAKETISDYDYDLETYNNA